MIRKEVGIYIRVGGWDICQTLALLGTPTNEISLLPKDEFIYTHNMTCHGSGVSHTTTL